MFGFLERLFGVAELVAGFLTVRRLSRRVRSFRMTQPKVFTAAVEEPEQPIPFVVEFHFADGRDRSSEAFTAIPRNMVSAGSMLTAGSTLRFLPNGDLIGDVSQMLPFFDDVLVKDDGPDEEDPEKGSSQRRFRALIADPVRLVRSELLSEIFYWLSGEYAARPTKRS